MSAADQGVRPTEPLVESELMRKVALVAVLAAGAGLCARQPVRARHGMVVTREAHATDIGVAVLESGGNAVDAAVAVGFALAVTHPAAGNIGGGGFMLVRFADGRTAFLDFRERAPEKASRNMYLDAAGKATSDSMLGYRAAGVPGTVRGLEIAHQKYGQKPWAELVAPAVELAAKGFPVSYGLARSLRSPDASARLGGFPESKRIFLRRRKVLRSRRHLRAARTGAHVWRGFGIAGAHDFYEGETAHLLAADMREHGGADHAGRSEKLQRCRAPAAHRQLSRLRHYHVAAAQFRRCRHPANAGRAGRLGIREIGRGLGRRTCTIWRKPCAAISPTAPTTWAIRIS